MGLGAGEANSSRSECETATAVADEAARRPAGVLRHELHIQVLSTGRVHLAMGSPYAMTGKVIRRLYVSRNTLVQ